MSEIQLKKGDTVTYKTVDMESYSRGYGVYYETKTSKVVEICYRLENGDLVTSKTLELQGETPKKEPKKE